MNPEGIIMHTFHTKHTIDFNSKENSEVSLDLMLFETYNSVKYRTVITNPVKGMT